MKRRRSRSPVKRQRSQSPRARSQPGGLDLKKIVVGGLVGATLLTLIAAIARSYLARRKDSASLADARKTNAQERIAGVSQAAPVTGDPSAAVAQIQAVNRQLIAGLQQQLSDVSKKLERNGKPVAQDTIDRLQQTTAALSTPPSPVVLPEGLTPRRTASDAGVHRLRHMESAMVAGPAADVRRERHMSNNIGARGLLQHVADRLQDVSTRTRQALDETQAQRDLLTHMQEDSRQQLSEMKDKEVESTRALLTKLQELQASIGSASGNRSERQLKEAQDGRTANRDTADKQLQDLRDQLAAASAGSAGLVDLERQLKEAQDGRTANRDTAEKQLQDLRDQLAAASAGSAGLADLERQLKEAQDGRTTNRGTAEKQLQDLRDQLAAASAGSAGLADLERQLKEARDDRTANRDTADKQLQDLRDQLAAASAGSAGLVDLERQLKEAQDGRTANRDTAEKQLQDLRDQLATASAGSAGLVDLERQLKEAQDGRASNRGTAEKQLQDLRDQLAAASAGGAGLVDLERQLKEAQDGRASNRGTAEKQLQDLRDQLAAASAGGAGLVDLERQLKEAQDGRASNRGTAEKQLQDLRDQLAAASAGGAGLVDLERQLKEAQDGRASNRRTAEKQLQDLRDQLAAASSGSAGLVNLERQLKEAQDGRASNRGTAEKQLQDLRDQLAEASAGSAGLVDLERQLKEAQDGRASNRGTAEKQLQDLRDQLAEASAGSAGLADLERQLKDAQSGRTTDKEAADRHVQELQNMVVAATAGAGGQQDLQRQLKIAQDGRASNNARSATAIQDLQRQLREAQDGRASNKDAADKRVKELQDQVAAATQDLQQQLKAAQDGRESNKDAADKRVKELQDLQQQLKAAQDGRASNKDVADKRVKELQDLQQQLKAAQDGRASNKDAADKRVKELQDQVAAATQDLQQQLKAAQDGRASNKDAADKRVKELQDLQQQLKEAQDGRASNKGAADAQLAAATRDSERKLTEADTRVKELQEQVGAATAGSSQGLQELQRQLQEAQDGRASNKSAADAQLAAATQDSERKSQANKKDLQNLRDQLSTGSSRTADLEKQAEQHERNKTALAGAEQRLRELADKCGAEHRQQVDELQQQAASQKTRIEQLEGTELVAAHQQAADVQARLTELQTKANTDRKETERLVAELAEAEQRRQKQEEEGAGLLARATAGDEQALMAQQLKLELSEAESRLKASDESMARLTKQLASNEELRTRLGTETQTLQETYEGLKRTLDEKEEALRSTRDRLVLAESEARAQSTRANGLSGESENVKRAAEAAVARATADLAQAKQECEEKLTGADQRVKEQAAEILKLTEQTTAVDPEHESLKQEVQRLASAALLDKTRLEDDRATIDKQMRQLQEKEEELAAGRAALEKADSNWKGVFSEKDEVLRRTANEQASDRAARNANRDKLVAATKELADTAAQLKLAQDELGRLQRQAGPTAATASVEKSNQDKVEAVRGLLRELIGYAEGRAKAGYETNLRSLPNRDLLAKEQSYKKQLREYKNAALVVVLVNLFDGRQQRAAPPANLRVQDNVVTLDGTRYKDFFAAQLWSGSIAPNYQSAVKEMVRSAALGGSTVLFTYGQSGSGKTQALFGSTQSPGLMLLALRDLSDSGCAVQHERDVCLYGILNIPRLLHKSLPAAGDGWEQQQPRWLADRRLLSSEVLPVPGGMHTRGNAVTADSIAQTLSNHPRISSTPNNPRSSRGHLFMTWRVTAADGQVGFLTFVDMAGAENPQAIAEAYGWDAYVRSRGDQARESPAIRQALFFSAMHRELPDPAKARPDELVLLAQRQVMLEGFYINETLNELADFFSLQQHKRLSDKRAVERLDGMWNEPRVKRYDLRKSFYTDAMARAACETDSADAQRAAVVDPAGFLSQLVTLRRMGQQSSVFTMLAVVNPFNTVGLSGIRDTLDFAQRL